MIRFGAIVSVVVVALVLLVAGAVSGALMLVYAAIAVAVLALLMLVVGVLVWRQEIFGPSAAARTAVGGPDVQFRSAAQFADEPIIARSGRSGAPGATLITDAGPAARSAAPGRPAAYAARGQAAEHGRQDYEPRTRVARDGRVAREDPIVGDGRVQGEGRGSKGARGSRDDRGRRPAWEGSAAEPAAAAGWAPAGGSAAEDDDRQYRREARAEPASAESARSEPARRRPKTVPDTRWQEQAARRRPAEPGEASPGPAGHAQTRPGAPGSAWPVPVIDESAAGPAAAARTSAGGGLPESVGDREPAAGTGRPPTSGPAQLNAAGRNRGQGEPAATPPGGASSAGPASGAAAWFGSAGPASPPVPGRPAQAGTPGTNGSPPPGPAPVAAAAADRTGSTPGQDASQGASGPAAADAAAAVEKPAAAPDLSRRVTVVPGIARYHNADCILIRFLGEDDLETMTLGKAEESGCVPCRACRPEKELASAL